MIDQAATIRAVRAIGEGFIALSRALEGNGTDEKPKVNTREDAWKVISTFKCPACHGEMVPRQARKDGTWFAGCKSYPNCKGTRNMEGVSNQSPPRRGGMAELDLDGNENEESPH
jgi:ssDNA-binding Zn-finger/Zn-ribbon topoisomerase 1